MAANRGQALSRDITLASAAYNLGDPEMSRRAHASTPRPEAGHAYEGNTLAWDDCCNAFALGACTVPLVATALRSQAAGREPDAGQLLRAVGLVSGSSALVLGFWRWLDLRMYEQHYTREESREEWELENFEEGEKMEMVELFKHQGMGQDDARRVIDVFAKYPKFFVSLMMREELHMNTPEPSALRRAQGVAAGCAAGALLPVLPLAYVAARSAFAASPSAASSAAGAAALREPEVVGRRLVVAAEGLALGALAAVGAAKAHIRNLPPMSHALEHMVLGATCALLPLALTAALARR
eukprot:TRINITY_DN13678_c0_g3_i1.p1 TRINITY_DN13678_c0_g3~~TRINITY_DN13678_c0_g3_i1.p1  ORF type:complete len:330 (+),score=81.48 TRINITY_DN13678_c0_g3_i1:101-991(+)